MKTTAPLSSDRPVQRWSEGVEMCLDDRLAVEEPLEIRIGCDGRDAAALSVTMRTPGHDEDLAAGFCVTEGIVDNPDQIERIAPCRAAVFGNIITVTLTPQAFAAHQRAIDDARRERFMSSSCGLCGKQSIERIRQHIAPIAGDFDVARSLIAQLPQQMRCAQRAFEETGGLHAAAIFAPDGRLLVLREDVGRHNAVDKVIGHMYLLDRVMIDPAILLVSGRSSFEIMQKAAMVGIPIIAAIGAPSTLAVDFAERSGQTLIGFVREDRMNVYTHRHRIALQ